jgi:hypothetical protein
MKKITTILFLMIAIAASAQKVTRKDLNRLLLKGDASRILDDGFKLIIDDSISKVYSRYDTTEVIEFFGHDLYYTAALESHNYRGRVEMTPKGDLLWYIRDSKYNPFYEEDENGEVTDSWWEYEMRRTVLEFRPIEQNGEKLLEFYVYIK